MYKAQIYIVHKQIYGILVVLKILWESVNLKKSPWDRDWDGAEGKG